MSESFAALPMYDWPEIPAETDAEWATIRARLRAAGVPAPDRIVRRNADMPPVPGGIRDGTGKPIAPDPAMLPPEALHFPSVWNHPQLIFGQTCWGPIEQGVASHVTVIGQPDYSAFEGGDGPLYSSAIVMRKGTAPRVEAPADGRVLLPLEAMRGRRFAYNSEDSMSGILAISRDVAATGESLKTLVGDMIETGAHRASISAVAEGKADVCAIDCRSWALARRFEPATQKVEVVGWTARRRGLPYIASPQMVERFPRLLTAMV